MHQGMNITCPFMSNERNDLWDHFISRSLICAVSDNIWETSHIVIQGVTYQWPRIHLSLQGSFLGGTALESIFFRAVIKIGFKVKTVSILLLLHVHTWQGMYKSDPTPTSLSKEVSLEDLFLCSLLSGIESLFRDFPERLTNDRRYVWNIFVPIGSSSYTKPSYPISGNKATISWGKLVPGLSKPPKRSPSFIRGVHIFIRYNIHIISI